MNHDQPFIDDATLAELDAYIDGTMPLDQREAFEQRLQDDPALAAQYELQGRIDQSLDRLFGGEMQRVAPSADVIRDRLALATDQVAERGNAGPLRSPLFRLVGIGGLAAAVLVIAATLLLNPDGPGGTGDGYDELQYVAVNTFYSDQIDAGFTPNWVCDNQRFTETIQDKLSRTMALAAMPNDRRMLGLSYVARARADSVVMLGRHNDQPILVFFDRANLADDFYDLDVAPGLHVHQRDFGDLRAIEVSPNATPAFLDYLSRPDFDE